MHCMQLYANVKSESAFAHSSSMDACIEVSPSQVLAPDPRARANRWKLSVFVPGDPVGAACFRTQFWQSPAHCIARNVERSNRKWPSIGYTHVHAKYSFSQPLEAFQRMSTGQARCVVVTGCMHFNFHQNGKCELAPGSFGLNYWTDYESDGGWVSCRAACFLHESLGTYWQKKTTEAPWSTSWYQDPSHIYSKAFSQKARAWMSIVSTGPLGSPKDLLADCRGSKILRLGKGGINRNPSLLHHQAENIWMHQALTWYDLVMWAVPGR